MEGAGVSCWISQRDIPPGADFALEIQKAITNCEYYVILLSKAAQDSPYVMLELHQAFNQKKEIIPVLLENFDLNEKASFYLDVKHRVDATGDIAAAAGTVIRKIKPEYTTMPAVTDKAPKRTNTAGRRTVCCPKCGCTVLKQKRLFVDRYLYPLGGRRNTGDKAMWILHNRNVINAYIGCAAGISAILLTIMSLCEVGNVCKTGNGWFRLVVYVLLACASGIITWLFEKTDAIPDVIRDLMNVISDSGLKYWTFKCANCEHEFSVLLPKEDQLKDWVPDLLEVNAKKDQSTDK